MKTTILTVIAAICASSATAQTDSIATDSFPELHLNEVVVTGRRPALRQKDGKLVYIVKNDPYSQGLDGIQVLDRIPRVSATDGNVSVAGKGNVRYIIDGILMELDATAMKARLQNLRAENIEKIELITTPPARYAAEANAVYISITTRNETLGTRGSVYGSLNQGVRFRQYLSGSISHTTRRVEMSLDANMFNYPTVNDNSMTYTFADATRTSDTRNRSRNLDTGVNALFRYKFTPELSAGFIANYSYGNSSSAGTNFTDYGLYTSQSVTATKSRPNNAVTATGFCDWQFGPDGRRLELTYNYFNRHNPTRSTIATTFDNAPGSVEIDERGTSDYRFHSGKADLTLPLRWARIETGAAYTDILNSSYLLTERSGAPGEEVDFDYRERIAAVHFSASRQLGSEFNAKIGLRYEYTATVADLLGADSRTRHSYGHLFPSATLSWSKPGKGSVNISYSMGMQRPNLWELNPFRYYSTTDEYSAGNPALRPTIFNNAEISYYGLGGLYAVLYTSFAKDAIGYIRRFDADGTVSTMPYNCLSTNKTGLYASYRRAILPRWEMTAGAEVFHTHSRSNMPDYDAASLDDFSGKLELSTDAMLNRARTLVFSARFSHYFPWQQNMIRYDSFQMLTLSLRYSMLAGRLNLRLSANDIFGWNKTRSTQHYASYTLRQVFDGRPAYVLLGVTYTFGRDKVAGVWRNSKEDQSGRTK